MDVCDRSIAPEAHYLAIEIGGTKQQAVVGTGDGRILERRQVKLGTETTAPGSWAGSWTRPGNSRRAGISGGSGPASAAPSTRTPA